MTAYAPSDVRSITVPHGCGTPHVAPDNLAEGERFSVTCDQCEPHIMALQGHGWAGDPLQVALTPDERARFAALDQEAQARRATTWADPDAIGKAVATALGMQTQAPPQVSLLDQIRALGADDKAALAGLLGLAPRAAAEPKPPTLDEQARRDLANEHRGDVVPDPGTPVAPATLPPTATAKKTTTSAKKATPPAAGT